MKEDNNITQETETVVNDDPLINVLTDDEIDVLISCIAMAGEMKFHQFKNIELEQDPYDVVDNLLHKLGVDEYERCDILYRRM